MTSPPLVSESCARSDSSGLTREHDTLPARLLNEPKPDGPTKGAVVPLEELKDDYYEAMGWDKETGNPGDVCLNMLDIAR